MVRTFPTSLLVLDTCEPESVVDSPADMYGNKAVVMNFEDMRYSYETFDAVPHPYCLPNVMNGLTYSLPFVTEKLTEFMITILNLCTQTEDREAEGPSFVLTGTAIGCGLRFDSHVDFLYLAYFRRGREG